MTQAHLPEREAPERLLSVLAALCCFGFWFFLPNTQIRLGPIGVSEFFGVCAVGAAISSSRLVLTREMLAAGILHVLFVAFTFINVFVAESILEGAVRDIIAVSYALAVAIAIANLMARYPMALKSSVLAMIACVFVYAVVLALAINGSIGWRVWFVEIDAEPQEVDVFADGVSILPRFIGLSTNPNQLAFFLLFIIFFVPSILRVVGLKRPLIIGIFSFGLALTLLLATQSDGAMLALAAGVAVAVFRLAYRSGGVWAVGSSYLAVLCLGFGFSLAWAWGLGEDGGGGRLRLWQDAVDLFDRAKGLGLGYGAHIPTDFGPNYEAHSFPLDLMLGVGVVGMGFVILILIYYGKEFLVRRDVRLLVPALVTLVFSLTYSPMRHPLFWIALFLPFVFRRDFDRV